MTAPKTVSLKELKAQRDGIVAPGPSGNHFKIRPLNLERHALNGGLPAKLRAIALEGAAGVQRLFESEDDTVSDEGKEVLGYLDGLVADVIVEPGLHADKDKVVTDPRTGVERHVKVGEADPEKIDLLLPVDYRWALNIAMGEEDSDGDGRRLWGREPLGRYATFREEHSCDADCPSCRRALARLSAAQR